MLSDGYGEQMSPDQIEHLILEKERLLAIQAAERGVNPNDWDDAINEARLTLWQVVTKRPNAAPAYLHASTGQRIGEVISRGTWTGHTGVRGKAIDPIRRTDRDSLDDPDWQVEIAAPDTLEAVLMAYHDGEVLQALAALPPRHREYVVRRFWYGWTNVECAPALGIKPGNVARMWNDTIQPVLAARLAHLVGA